MGACHKQLPNVHLVLQCWESCCEGLPKKGSINLPMYGYVGAQVGRDSGLELL